jgi:hypothetical protein
MRRVLDWGGCRMLRCLMVEGGMYPYILYIRKPMHCLCINRRPSSNRHTVHLQLLFLLIALSSSGLELLPRDYPRLDSQNGLACAHCGVGLCGLHQPATLELLESRTKRKAKGFHDHRLALNPPFPPSRFSHLPARLRTQVCPSWLSS